MTTVQSDPIVVRSMDTPDETNEFPLVRLDSTTLGDTTLVRVVAQPGWRWSTSVGPIVGAPLCPAPHTGYVISGRLAIRMDDGTEAELGAGDAFTCGGGHDGWVVGDETVQFLEVAPAAS